MENIPEDFLKALAYLLGLGVNTDRSWTEFARSNWDKLQSQRQLMFFVSYKSYNVELQLHLLQSGGLYMRCYQGTSDYADRVCDRFKYVLHPLGVEASLSTRAARYRAFVLGHSSREGYARQNHVGRSKPNSTDGVQADYTALDMELASIQHYGTELDYGDRSVYIMLTKLGGQLEVTIDDERSTLLEEMLDC